LGIDLFQSRNNRFNRNKWYHREYVENMKLQPDTIAQGVFYSTDKIPLQMQTLATGNIKKTIYTVTIETTDVVGDLKVDDYVLYGDELWLVDNIIANDENPAKEFSKRPSFVTEIRLRK
jgi:hypothetical protein